jgi:hypothetical protein
MLAVDCAEDVAATVRRLLAGPDGQTGPACKLVVGLATANAFVESVQGC